MDSAARVELLSTPSAVVVEEEEEVLRRPHHNNNNNNKAQRHRATRLWDVFGRRVPRSEIVFFCQTLIIYVVVVTSLVNLTLKNGPINLWTALLGSCLGYLLPHPSIDNNNNNTRRWTHHQEEEEEEERRV